MRFQNNERNKIGFPPPGYNPSIKYFAKGENEMSNGEDLLKKFETLKKNSDQLKSEKIVCV